MEYQKGIMEKAKNMNEVILEVTLLFILLIHTLRSFVMNDFFTIIISTIFFSLFTFFRLSRASEQKGVFTLLFLVFFIYLSMLINGMFRARNDSFVHDGVIITEEAYMAIVSLNNPYSVSYEQALKREKYLNDDLPKYASGHYPYSPGMVLLNFPLFALTEFVFGGIDMRINLVLFFLITAYVASLLIRMRILFLILYLLNPLFFPLLFYGSNDIVILCLLILSLYFLNLGKYKLASFSLALATSTKILAVPFVPLYFIYLYYVSHDKKIVLNNGAIFLIVNLIFYLPFLIWNQHDLIDDLVISWIGGGEFSHPIAGSLGIPQVLNFLGFVQGSSNFPFYIFFMPFSLMLIIYSFRFFRKNKSIADLCLLWVIHFLLFISFSRLIQTYYLAFASQLMLLGAFAVKKKV